MFRARVRMHLDEVEGRAGQQLGPLVRTRLRDRDRPRSPVGCPYDRGGLSREVGRILLGVRR